MAGTAGVGAAHRRAMALALPAPHDPDSRPAPLVPGDAVPASVLAGVRHWERGGAAGNRVVVVTFT